MMISNWKKTHGPHDLYKNIQRSKGSGLTMEMSTKLIRFRCFTKYDKKAWQPSEQETLT